MIRRLTLSNWRAYEDLDLQLVAGTTFLVAPNGVGKTSLVEAAAWALFGDHAAPADQSLRFGADTAMATVEVELPDSRILTVQRTRTAKANRKAPKLLVQLDGATQDPETLDEVLSAAFGAGPSFLARVVMPRPHAHESAGDGQQLRDHLCRLFGVETLLTTRADIDARLRQNDKDVRSAKQGSMVSAERLAKLEADVAAASAACAKATADHAQSRAVVTLTETSERAAVVLREWVLGEDRRQEAVAAALASAVELLESPVAPDNMATLVAQALEDSRGQLAAVVRALGINEGRDQTLEATRHELDEAHADCPVCRRPLDDHTLDAARAAHDHDRQTLAQELVALGDQEAELSERIAKLSSLQLAISSLATPTPKPNELAPNGATDPTAARQVEAAALEALVASTAARDNAQRDLDVARADESAHSTLVNLYAVAALLQAARTTIDRSVDAFVKETIGPIEGELRSRWAAIFPGRGSLQMDGAGAMSRPLNGSDLSFDSFSGGEQTVALVLLRLLITQMATKATFCWFDEPLEHLDPDARRQVASLLSGAGSSRPMKQVLVTTYEQTLAERLAYDSPQTVSRVAVRAATAHLDGFKIDG